MTTPMALPHNFPQYGKVATVVADAFAQMEKHDCRVETVSIHPSIAHRFAISVHENLDLDTTYKTVGSMWGATVEPCPEAPVGGFILKSEEESLVLRFELPNGPLPSAGGEVPVVFCKHPVRPQSVAELLDHGPPWGSRGSLRLELTANLYMGIRKFSRDILDIEWRADRLKTGIQGTLYGVTLVTSRSSHRTQITLRDDDRVYAILETDPAANPALKEMSERVLNGGCPEEYLTRIMSALDRSIAVAWEDIAYDLDDGNLDETQRVIMHTIAGRFYAKYCSRSRQ